MSEFEFISVFVSIVVALAMAELLKGWGRLMRSKQHIEQPFFYVGWSIWLLLLMCFHYLGLWEFQAIDFQTVGQLVLLLLPPIVLVLLVFVLAPERVRGQQINLEEHYYRVRYWFFGLSILFLILSFVTDMMLPDFTDTWLSRLFGPAIVVLTISVLLFSRQRTLHSAILQFNVLWLVIWSILQPVRSL